VDESANIQLSQILTFIENYITIGARNKGKEVAKKQQKNAKLTRQNASEDASQTQPKNTQPTQQQGNQEAGQKPKQKRQSYAEIAKKALKELLKSL
jgi:hypothetical protein